MIDRDRVVALCDAGKPDSIIAQEIGSSAEVVRRVLRGRRLDRPRRPYWHRHRLKIRAAQALQSAGFSEAEIARVLDLQRHQIKSMMSISVDGEAM